MLFFCWRFFACRCTGTTTARVPVGQQLTVRVPVGQQLLLFPVQFERRELQRLQGRAGTALSTDRRAKHQASPLQVTYGQETGCSCFRLSTTYEYLLVTIMYCCIYIYGKVHTACSTRAVFDCNTHRTRLNCAMPRHARAATSSQLLQRAGSTRRAGAPTKHMLSTAEEQVVPNIPSALFFHASSLRSV